MIMSYEFRVDAGCVGVIDKQYLIDNNGIFTDENLNKEVSLDPGKYNITMSCPKTWNGKVTQSHIIETNGKLILGDLCYLFPNHDDWMEFLKRTEYLQKSNEKFFVVNTGGDGEFNFKIKVRKLYD